MKIKTEHVYPPISNRSFDWSAIALHSCIAELGGEVEGHPTARHNFLQRIRQLRAMEAENARLHRLVMLYRAQADHALRKSFEKDVDSLGAKSLRCLKKKQRSGRA